MLIFVKRRNQVQQPAELIPWKISNSEGSIEEDIKVPIRASIISISLLVFGILAFVCLTLIGKLNMWLSLSFFMSIKLVILPLILIFTIKHKIVKTFDVQPPRNLQFHEQFDQQISHCLQFHEEGPDEGLELVQIERNIIVNEAESSQIPNAIAQCCEFS